MTRSVVPILLLTAACATGPGYPSLADTQGPTCNEGSSENLTAAVIAATVDLDRVLRWVDARASETPLEVGPTLVSVHRHTRLQPQTYPLAGEAPRAFQEALAEAVHEALIPQPDDDEADAMDPARPDADAEDRPEVAPPGSFRLEVRPGPPSSITFHPIWLCSPRTRNEDRIRELLTESYEDFPLGSWQIHFHVFVTEQGRAETVEIETSSGNSTVDQLFLQVIRRARWDPARIDGIPVPVWVGLPLSLDRVPGT